MLAIPAFASDSCSARPTPGRARTDSSGRSGWNTNGWGLMSVGLIAVSVGLIAVSVGLINVSVGLIVGVSVGNTVDVGNAVSVGLIVAVSVGSVGSVGLIVGMALGAETSDPPPSRNLLCGLL